MNFTREYNNTLKWMPRSTTTTTTTDNNPILNILVSMFTFHLSIRTSSAAAVSSSATTRAFFVSRFYFFECNFSSTTSTEDERLRVLLIDFSFRCSAFSSDGFLLNVFFC